MKTFTVYHHSVSGYEAVKEGFSWPGFFFTWIWAFVKGLSRIGWLLLLAWLAAPILILSREPGLTALAGLGMLVVVLWVGFEGNHWRRNALGKQGYQLIDAVHAESSEAAISKARQEQGMDPNIEAAAIRVLEENGIGSKSGGSAKTA